MASSRKPRVALLTDLGNAGVSRPGRRELSGGIAPPARRKSALGLMFAATAASEQSSGGAF
jgi:hypothetical protein